MLKVFIADDEIFIVELLKNLIDWQSLNLDIIGTAYDGITALNIIKEQKPDIVITDIRMPNCDGLALVQEVLTFHPDTSFIIISGHSNFNYAQTALRFGVKDYLLKPINADDLTTTLLGLIENIQSRAKQTCVITEINEKLSIATCKLHESFLAYIYENETLPLHTLEQINNEYMLKFREGKYLFFLLKIYNKGPAANLEFMELLYNNMLPNTLRLLRPLCFELAYAIRGSKCLFIANLGDGNLPCFEAELQNLLQENERLLQRYDDLFLTLSRGSLQSCVSGIATSCQDAKRALRSRILGNQNALIEAPAAYTSKNDLAAIFTSDSKNILLRSIERFDIAEIKSQIIQLFAIAESSHIEHADFYWDLTNEIYFLFLNAIQSLGVVKDVNAQAKALRLELEDCLNINAIQAALLQKLQQYIDQYEDIENSSENIPISIAKKYISEHYMEKITLQCVAQLVYLNPVYFSILFKKQVGTNFVDYVNNFRVEVSKKLLKNIALSILDVANQAGFSNAKYFAKTFKAIVGITPTQYRSKYMRHMTAMN